MRAKVKVPADEGVPLIEEEFSVKPGGMEPEASTSGFGEIV
jgi:hypothetical protein